MADDREERTGEQAPEWSFVYEGFDPPVEGLREALCTLGNGAFATRGAAADSDADEVHYPGTYLAGGYNRLKSEVAGREIENEDLVNMPNWLPLRVRIDDGPWLRADELERLTYRQRLDLRRGLLERELRLRDAEGRTTRITSKRLVHMEDPHLAAEAMEIVPEDWSGTLTVRSALDGEVTNAGVARYRALRCQHLQPDRVALIDPDLILLVVETSQSRLRIAEAARTRVRRNGTDVEAARQNQQRPMYIAQDIPVPVERGDRIEVEKVVALYTSRDRAISEPGLEAEHRARIAGDFEALLARHALAWEALWRRCDLDLGPETDEHTRRVLRLHIFHILQTTSHHSTDLDTGIPARGWHGEAYRGHIFWDELFVFPFLNLRLPVLTRALLRYRHRRLERARELAREAGYRGALFPWQSGSDGREESQRLHLNPISGRWLPDPTHLQRHINSAIAYNVWQYYQSTGDTEFLYDYGAEMILEIARFWGSFVRYDPKSDRYDLPGVVGPDEFHTAYPGSERDGIDNNAYTNVMAAWTLCRAREVLQLLPAERRAELRRALDLRDAELGHWDEVSRRIRVPFHDGLISQFEGYGELEELDWDRLRRTYGDIHRIDRILEAEGDTPNRYKVSKQADVLMLFYLLSSEELQELMDRLGYPFDPASIPEHVEYYRKRTSHGSTLSRVVLSWVLARSSRERSWRLFRLALDSDVADVQGGTTPEGIHLGAMAGTVDLIQRAYTGIETRGDLLRFAPRLPRDLQTLRMTLRYRRQPLAIEISRGTLRVTSIWWTAEPVQIAYRDEIRTLRGGDCHVFRLTSTEEAINA